MDAKPRQRIEPDRSHLPAAPKEDKPSFLKSFAQKVGGAKQAITHNSTQIGKAVVGLVTGVGSSGAKQAYQLPSASYWSRAGS